MGVTEQSINLVKEFEDEISDEIIADGDNSSLGSTNP